MKWLTDTGLGVRLAVGGGRTLRTGLLRLALTTIGIGLSTAVLLLLATMATALADRTDRIAAREADTSVHEGTALYTLEDLSYFRGDQITISYLDPAGPGAPIPPGLQAIPRPGEMVVSPALAEKLNSDAGLRGRFDQRVVGTIAPEGLAGPTDLWIYAGGAGVRNSPEADAVYRYGAPSSLDNLPPQVVFVGGMGVVVLLLPLLVFIATTSRIAGAERERRLSALRLAGAGAGQVRRIGAAESLVGAVTGALLGLVVFLSVWPFAANVQLDGIAVFPADFVPAWPLVVIVFLLLPLLAVGSAWFGMRGLIVEPLGVVRRARPVRRRLWWRLLLVVLGVLLLFPDKVFGMDKRPGDVVLFLGVGLILLLVGVPTLMPWVTERAVSRIRGGAPSWQLAIRRLQLDSGTPSRVVAGVVVVLAGVIAMQTTLDGADIASTNSSASYRDSSTATIMVDAATEAEALTLLDGTPGVQAISPEQWVSLKAEGRQYELLMVAPCAALARFYQLPNCVDGDSFTLDGVQPGATYGTRAFSSPATGAPFTVPVTGKPATVLPGQEDMEANATVLATPGAVSGLVLPGSSRQLKVHLDPGDPNALDRVHDAVSPLEWRMSINSGSEVFSSGNPTLDVMGGLLEAGAMLALLLAGVSLLVMAAGQISERRRPLAAMSAGGVPRSVLARSLLWQNAVPVVFGVLMAVGAGIGIAALVIRLMSDSGIPFVLDGTFIVVVAAVAVALVLVVTAATLPALRSATKLEALRAE